MNILSFIEWQILGSLVVAHLLGDFVFQTDGDVKGKQKLSALKFLKHSMIMALWSYVLVGLWASWRIPLFLGITHFIIDGMKETVTQRKIRKKDGGRLTSGFKIWAFSVDQLLHIMVMVGLALYISKTSILCIKPFWFSQFGTIWTQLLVLVAGLVLTVYVGGVIIGYWVGLFLDQLRNAKEKEPSTDEARGFENGGKVIGQLERALIFLFVVTGQPAGVGFLVTAKSIFRFGELKDAKERMEAEYIIIGTLMSFGWGLTWAWLTQRLLQII
ncbi:MAG TPA: DUF3307 domain-containing protein [Kiritimatiellia bacterium]|jgi:hypothetical protein|nr:DUF3307 domain-containing protein [Kiritimatiellia bacterium]HPA77743.1 DUF3307 domain-containing protein [Kiritimatiellia bacterium]HQQ04507.1 DUF3307 domain-containing protein [Kiritimatiellia bacterium]HRX00745.1 DUF3307 domain-containing protein [Cyclobacteriaceae bacterium]